MIAAAAAGVLSSDISGDSLGTVSAVAAGVDKPDIVDSEYQFSENKQQNLAIMIITCVVAVLGAICVFTLLYIGIRLLSNDSMGSSPSSKLNRSDDSGHIMIGGSSLASPEGKLLLMEPKYYIQAGTGSHPSHGGGVIAGVPAKNLFATNMAPSMAGQHRHQLEKNEKLSALEYHLLAPQLVSKLEKGSSGDEESASDRLLKPMISSSGVGGSSCRSSNNNNCRRSNNNNNQNRTSIDSTAQDCNCNLAKNCRNCCSTNVKFTNERFQGK